jgi:hypothetical protein
MGKVCGQPLIQLPIHRSDIVFHPLFKHLKGCRRGGAGLAPPPQQTVNNGGLLSGGYGEHGGGGSDMVNDLWL